MQKVDATMAKSIRLGAVTCMLTCLAPLRSGLALSDYVQVSAGSAHTVGRQEDGTVWAWGGNRHGLRGHGVLGDGSTTSGRETMNHSSMPVAVKGGVVRGLQSFQHDTSTQTVVEFDFPEPVSEVLEGIRMVAAGHHFSLALAEDGKVWAWGSNAFGQLGDGSDHFRFPFCRSASLPIPVRNAAGDGHLTGIAAVAAGNHHSLALANDGTVRAWGVNTQGQLGDGTTEHRSLPARVIDSDASGGLARVVAVAAGTTHSVALKADGTVWSWGGNAFGQLGDGTREARLTPVQVRQNAGGAPLRDVVAVSAGQSFSVVLRADGRVLAWGSNAAGQLGDGTREHRATPMPVMSAEGNGPLTAVKAVSAGRQHVAALLENGTVVAWGLNSDGQLGNGTLATALTPVPVSKTASGNRLPSVTGLSAGFNHTTAICANGFVWSWGGNANGQLGNNTTMASALPVQLREMPRGMFEIGHGAGRWTQWTFLAPRGVRRTHDPGWMLHVENAPARRVLRHHIAEPVDPVHPGAARETEATDLVFTSVETGFLKIAFDARVSSAASRTLDIRLLPGAEVRAPTQYRQVWTLVWGRTPGKLHARPGGDFADIDETWRRYAIVTNLDERTYDVWMDGERVAEALGFRSSTDRLPHGTPIGRIRFGTTHDDRHMTSGATVVDGTYADVTNIRIVSAPEPPDATLNR